MYSAGAPCSRHHPRRSTSRDRSSRAIDLTRPAPPHPTCPPPNLPNDRVPEGGPPARSRGRSAARPPEVARGAPQHTPPLPILRTRPRAPIGHDPRHSHRTSRAPVAGIHLSRRPTQPLYSRGYRWIRAPIDGYAPLTRHRHRRPHPRVTPGAAHADAAAAVAAASPPRHQHTRTYHTRATPQRAPGQRHAAKRPRPSAAPLARQTILSRPILARSRSQARAQHSGFAPPTSHTCPPRSIGHCSRCPSGYTAPPHLSPALYYALCDTEYARQLRSTHRCEPPSRTATRDSCALARPLRTRPSPLPSATPSPLSAATPVHRYTCLTAVYLMRAPT
jgi:hypothetical protein